jgi:hypothetical protein
MPSPAGKVLKPQGHDFALICYVVRLSFVSNFMNKSKLNTVLAINAGAILGVCLAVWYLGTEVNRMTAVKIGILGILILDVALALKFKASQNTSEPNHRSHFGSILMFVLILFAILLHFVSK